MAIAFLHSFIYISAGQYKGGTLAFLPFYCIMHLQRWHQCYSFLLSLDTGQLIGIQVGLHKLPLATSVAFSVAFIFICYVLFAVNGSEVLTVGMSIVSHSLHLYFGRREKSCSRRQTTAPNSFVNNKSKLWAVCDWVCLSFTACKTSGTLNKIWPTFIFT